MKCLTIFNVCLLLVMVVVVQGNIFISEIAQENFISRLYRDKLANYNKEARPVRDHSRNTTIHIGLSLNRIDMSDEVQEMSVNAWTIMTWKDEFLEWAPQNYMSIERIHFDATDIWMPDITHYNSADGSDVVPFGRVPVLVDHFGQIYWFPPTHLKVKCDLDLSKWPNDEHECLVRIGSWSHHGEQIDLQLLQHNESESSSVMMSNFEENNRWKLKDVKAEREVISVDGHDPYVEIDFTFTVKREARTHAIYVTQSALAVVIIVLLSYALPTHYFFSRLIMHLFALAILISCYLTLFSTLPSNGGPIPVVVRYYSGTLVLTTISLLCTVFLTSRGCCSSDGNVSSDGISKKVVGFVSATPFLRNVVSSDQNYNQLEAEMVEEGDGSRQNQPQEGAVSTTLNVRRIVNFLLLVLFAVAFMVDYVVLRSVTV